jgi:uncharacterized protein
MRPYRYAKYTMAAPIATQKAIIQTIMVESIGQARVDKGFSPSWICRCPGLRCRECRRRFSVRSKVSKLTTRARDIAMNHPPLVVSMAPIRPPAELAASAANRLAPHPTASSLPLGQPRISSLDFLRGFALLGILVMNVQAFSMPIAAYFNPTAWGSLRGLNGAVWFLGHLFVDQKFMTLFSILFGAGIVLMTGKAEQRTGSSWRVHYRRMAWLALFGAVHAWLLWYGDILFTYAICAMVLFPFRRASARKLLVAGVAVFAVASLIGVLFGILLPSLSPATADHARAGWDPTEAELASEVSAYRGTWGEQNHHRWEMAAYIETEILLTYWGWKASGLMLMGMALFKSGVLSASRDASFYRHLSAWGFGLGLPLVLVGVAANVALDWDLRASYFTSQANYWGSLGVALGYVGVLMLLVKRRRFLGAQERVGNVGRMAFTNYLLQTVLATSLFYGHGLGLFGSVSRTGQFAVVLAICTLQVLLSTWWLRRFSLGPLEWLWRTLTYLRMQPLRLPSEHRPRTPGTPPG